MISLVDLFQKIDTSLTYHYYSYKDAWHFPASMAHQTGAKIVRNRYEPEVTSLLKRLITKGDTFIDVGANVGYFSLLASEQTGKEGLVCAFEPELENYTCLKRNSAGKQNVLPIMLGISDSRSFMNVNKSSHSSCHSLVETENYLTGETFPAVTTTLDHFWQCYLDQKPVKLVKIDTEGAELMVLRGMEQMIKNKAVCHIILEYCPALAQAAGTTTDFSRGLYELLTPQFSLKPIESEANDLFRDNFLNSVRDLLDLRDYLVAQKGKRKVNLLCSSK
jgi:FkbM family methyltransferase